MVVPVAAALARVLSASFRMAQPLLAVMARVAATAIHVILAMGGWDVRVVRHYRQLAPKERSLPVEQTALALSATTTIIRAACVLQVHFVV